MTKLNMNKVMENSGTHAELLNLLNSLTQMRLKVEMR